MQTNTMLFNNAKEVVDFVCNTVNTKKIFKRALDDFQLEHIYIEHETIATDEIEYYLIPFVDAGTWDTVQALSVHPDLHLECDDPPRACPAMDIDVTGMIDIVEELKKRTDWR